MFALSTSWNALQYSQAKDIIEEINALGVQEVELSFNLSSSIVEEMISLSDQGLIKVVSVHNFCPIPEGTSRKNASPEMFSLSALDEREREKALAYTKKTIQTACRIGAKVVILHAGRVQMQEKIKQLALTLNNNETLKYQKLKEQMLKERQKKSKKFFNQTLESLQELCSYAQKQKVKLGIENRFYFSEIPDIEEMEVILQNFPAPPLYYWHDVGHAQVYENLKFMEHKTFLDKFSYRMVGMHLHDIEGIDDHRAPLTGKFDFTLLKPYLRKETLKVLEPHYPATAEQIIRAKKYLEQLLP